MLHKHSHLHKETHVNNNTIGVEFGSGSRFEMLTKPKKIVYTLYNGISYGSVRRKKSVTLVVIR